MFPPPGFENSPVLFDRVQVGRVSRQIFQRTPLAFDKGFGGRGLVEGRVVHQDNLARPERGHQDLFQPGIEHKGVTIALKAHGGPQPRLMQGRDETDALRFGAGDVSQHWRAAGGPSIGTMQRFIHPTFVKIDEVGWGPGGQLLLKPCAGSLVAFGVPQRLFFA